MQNDGRLYAQVAAVAGVPAEKAMVACYLSNLAKDGRSLDDAARLLRKQRADVRDVARNWGIRFVDYVSSDAPLELVWTKLKRGQWALMLGDVNVAEMKSDGHGGYEARKNGEDLTHFGSSPEIAAGRCAANLERRSVEVFGLDDVRMLFVQPDGSTTICAPKPANNAGKLREALAA